MTASPRIVISTSRKPSQRTRSLCKELKLMLPSARYLQRGKQSFEELLQASTEVGCQRLLVVGERNGNPGSLELYFTREAKSPVVSLRIGGVRLAREYGSSVKNPSTALTFASDTSEISMSLAKMLETYFESELYTRRRLVGSDIRVLSITDQAHGQVRLIFKDSESPSNLGPSMTGGWNRIEER